MSLDFPLLVRSRNFFFFFCLRGGKGAVFLLCFCPLSREGNSRLHSIPSNYSSFYGSVKIKRIVVQLLSIEKYLNRWVKTLSLRAKDLPYIDIFTTLTLVTHHLALHNFYDS